MDNKERIAIFQRLVSKKLTPLITNDYVLLDIPNHCNIGDNLIWEGELQFLRKNIPHNCLYSANVYNWEEKKIQDSPLILFHGGGNFGDLYRIHQEHRLYVIQKYRHKRIIVFPQTVWYNNKSLLKGDSETINAHPDIYICTRDQLSYDTLSQYIHKDKLLLLPDMAFCINVLPSSHYIDSKKTLFLLRTDFEIDRCVLTNKEDYDIKDWPTYYNNKYVQVAVNKFRNLKLGLSILLQRIPILSKIVDPVYGLNNRGNRNIYINIGVRFLNNYSKIYTTRLHGLILGILLGKNVTIVDNKYNKCKNFYNTWLEDFDMINVR